MDAWTIYWILQLDSIVGMFVALAVGGGIAALISGVISLVATGPYGDEEVSSSGAKWFRRSLVVSLVGIAFTAFIPSSKTAAAMVILPAIANNETIRKEAGDLYQLAKQALRDAVADEESNNKSAD